MKKRLHKMSGFTLIELMVTIAIVAILLTIAIPSFREMIMDNRISMRTNNFIDIIQFARSEAVSSGEPVTVTGTADGANEWGAGVVVSRGADTLRILEAFQSGVTLDSDGFNTFTFNPTGEADFMGTENLDMCDGRSGETGRRLQILGSGLIRVTTFGC